MNKKQDKAQGLALEIGFIYKCYSESDDKIYYGHTVDIKERMRAHRSIYNKCMSVWIVGELKFEVLETLHNITKSFLRDRERWWLENHNDDKYWIINKQLPNQTTSEYHKKRYAEKAKYYAAKQKCYYWENWEKEQVRMKKYAAKRKDDTWYCEKCNNLMSWTSKKCHIKTKKHLNDSSTTTTHSVPLKNASI
tara:strand:+ start:144 stop:722 length:579 start_codon:yes stop_codon:yes gene_type:complete